MDAAAIERLALIRAADIAIDLEVQLEKGTATRPVLAILAKAKEEAAEGMAALVDCNPNDPIEIMTYQLQVRRFGDLVRWCKRLFEDGRFAESIISEDDREEIAAIIGGETGEGT